MRRTWGRCPHCGESVTVEAIADESLKIGVHADHESGDYRGDRES